MIAKFNYPQVWMLILAWFVADLAAPLIIRLCHRIGALDRPGGYKAHAEPVAILGGVVIYLAFAAALFSILRFTDFESNRDVFAILLGGFVVLVVGCVDDFRPLWAVLKLALLFVVTLILSRFGVGIVLTGVPAADLALTLLWIVGVSSAMNSLDNMDGAAAGVAAIAAFWTFYIAWYSEPLGQERVSYVAIAILGACLGFLRYNFRSARIFLGDNGSLLLGFLLAALTVQAGWAAGDSFKAIIVPCAILCVPLYDITLSTLLRIRHRVVTGPIEAIVYCGRDHLSHRLVALGFSPREAVLSLYLLGTLSGTVGIIIARPGVTRPLYLTLVGVGVAVLAVLAVFLDRAKVYPHQQPDGVEAAPAGAPAKEQGMERLEREIGEER